MTGHMRRSLGTGALWGLAAFAAVAGHAAVAAIALNWTPEGHLPPAAPPVLMIDLEPIVAPPVPERQVAPGPQAVESKPQDERPLPDKVIERAPDVPQLPEVKERAVAVLPPPMPQPKPDIAPELRDKQDEHKVASRAAAPATFEAPRAPRAHARAAGVARVPVAALASWKNEVIARLNRYKRYPAGASGTGTATVAFSIGPSGAVTSARLAHSSGDRALDEEAVALPRRASPLPKPPDGLATGAIPVTVPIYFARR